MAHVFPTQALGTGSFSVTQTASGARIYEPASPPVGQIPVIPPAAVSQASAPASGYAYAYPFHSAFPPPPPLPHGVSSPSSGEPQRRQVVPLDMAPGASEGPRHSGGDASARKEPQAGVDSNPVPFENERKSQAPPSTRAAVAEASHLKAQVRVLEHEVKTLRDGLTRTAQLSSASSRAASASRSPAQGRATATAAAGASVGKPEIAFGRRVQPSSYTASSSATAAAASTTRATKTVSFAKRSTSSQPRARHAEGPASHSPPSASTSVSRHATSNPHANMQPLVVPVWEENREIPLQGSATGGTLLPAGQGTTTSTVALDRTEEPAPSSRGKYYWLSADPISLPRRTAAIPTPPSAQPSPAEAKATSALNTSTTVVQLSPAASADSLHVANLLSRHTQQQPTASDTASMEAELVEARRLVSWQADRITQQEHSLRAMALALVELEQRVAQEQKAAPVSTNIVQGTALAPAEHGDSTETQRQAALLTLAKQLAETQKREGDAVAHTTQAEAALSEARAENERLKMALDTLKKENERLIAVSPHGASSPVGGGSAAQSPSPPCSSSPAAAAPARDASAKPAPAASAENAEDKHRSSDAVVADLKRQNETLRARLKAWERWYFTVHQQEQTQGQQEAPRNRMHEDSRCQCHNRQVPLTESKKPRHQECGCCLSGAPEPPYYSLYEMVHGRSPFPGTGPVAEEQSTNPFFTGGAAAPRATSHGATADPLEYLRAWRRYLPETMEAGHTKEKVDDKDRDVVKTPQPVASEAPQARQAISVQGDAAAGTQSSNPTSSAVYESHGYFSPEVQRLLQETWLGLGSPHDRCDSNEAASVAAFLAKERALRELATAEHELAEERLRKMLLASREGANGESTTAAAADSSTPIHQRTTVPGSVCTP